MGHYTPQAHLKRFEIAEKPEFIWMYDKKTEKFKEIHVSNVAQEPHYYPPDVEDDLNHLVEIPGGYCIDKLLRAESLTQKERHDLSVYLFTMRSRGPRQRSKAEKTAERVFPEVLAETREMIQYWKENAETEDERQLAKSKLSEFEELEQRWQQKPPDFLERLIKTPHIGQLTVKAIREMTWEILPVAPGMQFITSDTPAHYFESLGLGDKECQFTFTITKDAALVGHYRGKPGSTLYHRPISPYMTKEINRRILSTTERFVFCSRKETWICAAAKKANPFLSLILF